MNTRHAARGRELIGPCPELPTASTARPRRQLSDCRGSPLASPARMRRSRRLRSLSSGSFWRCLRNNAYLGAFLPRQCPARAAAGAFAFRLPATRASGRCRTEFSPSPGRLQRTRGVPLDIACQPCRACGERGMKRITARAFAGAQPQNVSHGMPGNFRAVAQQWPTRRADDDRR